MSEEVKPPEPAHPKQKFLLCCTTSITLEAYDYVIGRMGGIEEMRCRLNEVFFKAGMAALEYELKIYAKKDIPIT